MTDFVWPFPVGDDLVKVAAAADWFLEVGRPDYEAAAREMLTAVPTPTAWLMWIRTRIRTRTGTGTGTWTWTRSRTAIWTRTGTGTGTAYGR